MNSIMMGSLISTNFSLGWTLPDFFKKMGTGETTVAGWSIFLVVLSLAIISFILISGGILALGFYGIYRGFIGDNLLWILAGIFITGFFPGLFVYIFFSFYYRNRRDEIRKKNNKRSK